MRRIAEAVALALATAPLSAAPPAGDAIEVSVTSIRSDAGLIRVAVCPERTFLAACPWQVSVPARKGTVVALVRGVPPGRYAIQAYHDANSNNDVDRGIFGIPKEGIGFSNDAMSRLKRPKFSDAAFDHRAQAQHLTVMLRYFLG